MEHFLSALTSYIASAGMRIALAILLFIAGRIAIRALLGLVSESRLLLKAEGAVRTFTLSLIHIGCGLLLAVLIIGVLGVPVASIAALIASAGVAIGLAFQGALSNLAGGLMLVIFKPFKLGDFIEAAGVTGTAKEITLFYTVVNTLDNKRVTIPNGSLMNANITDYSAEETRRVDLAFSCARSEQPARVREIIQKTVLAHPLVLPSPEAPLVRLNEAARDSFSFTVRAWCKNADYLTVYFDLTEQVSEALLAAGIQPPALNINAPQAADRPL